MVWRDASKEHGIGIKQAGVPPKDIYDHEGYFLVRKNVNQELTYRDE